MVPIPIPATVGEFQEMDSTPTRALTFATNLRAVTVGVKDVQAWAEGHSAPGWQGDTHEAHDHATTRFAVRLDTVEAVLDRAVTAADRFESRLLELGTLRGPIEKERSSVNTDAEALRAEVAGVAGLDAAEVEALERRGRRLVSRAFEVSGEIADWTSRYLDAEADFIAALRTVDTVAEGGTAAAAPDRVDADPLADRFRRLANDPVALAAWWNRLDRSQRQAVITEHPQLVGNAGGIPAADRDEANRAAIHSDVDYYGQRERDGQLSRDERSAYENARHVRDSVNEYRYLIDPATGRELLHVLVYEPGIHSGDGGVAISFGDPDLADHVSANIPGLTTESSSTSDNLATTLGLHNAAVAEGNGTVASIYWLDYDAPSGNPLLPWEVGDVGGVAFAGKADEGGERFSDFIDGLHASDRGEAAHVTAIGHSYGSTTLGHALEDGLRVDDAVVIGSPGQPVATAEALTDAEVWVGSKDNDPVTLLGDGQRGGLGVLGHDPAEDDFGGRRFETGDGSRRIEDLIDNHTSYFSGDSLDNIAHVVADRDGEVTYQPARGDDGGEYLTLEELLAVSTGASAGEVIWDHGGEWLFERGKDGIDVGEWLLERSRIGGIL